ncbi:MAG TPA: methyltransferase [Bacteroidetes bacterium]|nr:methyltransferase [Bacteroidota bacterium]
MKKSGPPGTYEIIWETVRLIPRGRVASYGQVAVEAGLPGQARLVGYALHALPPSSGVPWHRVINSQGKISFPPGSPAYSRQRLLLQREGIVLEDGKIDMKRYGWLRKMHIR